MTVRGDIGGRREREGQMITVTGRGKTKKLLKPKLKPTVHNAFAFPNPMTPPHQLQHERTTTENG